MTKGDVAVTIFVDHESGTWGRVRAAGIDDELLGSRGVLFGGTACAHDESVIKVSFRDKALGWAGQLNS